MREMALRERAPSALMVGESRRRGLRVATNLAARLRGGSAQSDSGGSAQSGSGRRAQSGSGGTAVDM